MLTDLQTSGPETASAFLLVTLVVALILGNLDGNSDFHLAGWNQGKTKRPAPT